MKRKTEI